MSEQTLPRFYIPVDERSIERATSAVAKHMKWDDEREGSAELLVALVWKALESTSTDQEQNKNAD